MLGCADAESDAAQHSLSGGVRALGHACVLPCSMLSPYDEMTRAGCRDTATADMVTRGVIDLNRLSVTELRTRGWTCAVIQNWKVLPFRQVHQQAVQVQIACCCASGRQAVRLQRPYASTCQAAHWLETGKAALRRCGVGCQPMCSAAWYGTASFHGFTRLSSDQQHKMQRKGHSR